VLSPKSIAEVVGVVEDVKDGSLDSEIWPAVYYPFDQAGDTFFYSGATIRVLAPDPQFPVRTSHRNDESLVMKISYGKTPALLEADAEKGTENSSRPSSLPLTC